MRDNLTIRNVCVVGALIGALTGCGPTAAPPGPSPGAAPSPAEVGVARPRRMALRRVVEQPGTVQAHEETQLFARVPGYVRKVGADIGQKIRGPREGLSDEGPVPGEVLAELEVPELEEEANQRQALVRQAEAQVEQADKALAAAGANVTVSQATVAEARAFYDRWESESRRMTGLVNSGVVDAQSRDEVLNQFRAGGGRLSAARASVLKARADRDKAMADVRAAKARVDVARAEARRVEAMLGYGKIRAPYDGVVTGRKVSTGDLVQPAAAKGDWLFTVARLDPVRVVVAVPEADAELVEEKAKVKLSIPAAGGLVREVAVTRTSWALAPGARTLRAEIDLPNPRHKLRPGMYVYARIVGEAAEGWALPASAVVKEGGAAFCYLISEGKAVRAPVRVGRTDGQLVEVPRVRKPGATSWSEWTGAEEVAARAAGLKDGQAVRAP